MMKPCRQMLFFGMVLCFLFAFAMPGFAAESICCTVHCESAAGAPVAGELFSLYHVATIDKDGSYDATAAFEKYAVALDGLSSADTKTAAETLAAYVERDIVMPTDSAQTDANGNAVFPHNVASLQEGLYLILGQNHEIDGKLHVFEPILVALPAKDSNGALLYDVMLHSKHSERSDITSITVTKSWKDSDSDKRPASVEAELLKDGEVYDTVTLDAKNNWRHTWDHLPAGCDWLVTEKTVPENYTVQIKREQSSVVITNTSTDKSTDTEKNTTGTTDSNKSSSSSNKKLPQTGTLQWPVPVLAAVGMGLLLLGLLRRRSQR